MDSTETQFIGAPCGFHGSYTFYKAFRFNFNGKVNILKLGEYFFMKISDGFPVCIGETQLLWNEKGTSQLLASIRLYFKPFDTPGDPLDSKFSYGDDEMLAMSEKLILTVDELVKHLIPHHEVQWDYGKPVECYYNLSSTERSIADSSPALCEVFAQSTLPQISFDDVDCERKKCGAEPKDLLAPVLLLTYPQYCRYRAMLKRLEHCTDLWLKNTLAAAIGGCLTSLRPGMRVTFVREVFRYGNLHELEFHLDHLAPKLKGRRRKRKLKKDDSDSNSFTSDYSSCSSNTTYKVKIQSMLTRSKQRRETASMKECVEHKPGLQEKIFLKKLHDFMARRNSPIVRLPSLGFKKICLYTFFKAAERLGGYTKICANRKWKAIYDILGGDPRNTSAATSTRRHYETLLWPYEKYLRKTEKGKQGSRQVMPRTKDVIKAFQSTKPVRNGCLKVISQVEDGSDKARCRTADGLQTSGTSTETVVEPFSLASVKEEKNSTPSPLDSDSKDLKAPLLRHISGPQTEKCKRCTSPKVLIEKNPLLLSYTCSQTKKVKLAVVSQDSMLAEKGTVCQTELDGHVERKPDVSTNSTSSHKMNRIEDQPNVSARPAAPLEMSLVPNDLATAVRPPVLPEPPMSVPFKAESPHHGSTLPRTSPMSASLLFASQDTKSSAYSGKNDWQQVYYSRSHSAMPYNRHANSIPGHVPFQHFSQESSFFPQNFPVVNADSKLPPTMLNFGLASHLVNPPIDPHVLAQLHSLHNPLPLSDLCPAHSNYIKPRMPPDNIPIPQHMTQQRVYKEMAGNPSNFSPDSNRLTSQSYAQCLPRAKYPKTDSHHHKVKSPSQIGRGSPCDQAQDLVSGNFIPVRQTNGGACHGRSHTYRGSPYSKTNHGSISGQDKGSSGKVTPKHRSGTSATPGSSSISQNVDTGVGDPTTPRITGTPLPPQQHPLLLQSQLFGSQFTALPRPGTSRDPFMPAVLPYRPDYLQQLSQGYAATSATDPFNMYSLDPAHALFLQDYMQQAALSSVPGVVPPFMMNPLPHSSTPPPKRS